MPSPRSSSVVLPTAIALLALAVSAGGFLLIQDMRGEMRDIARKLDEPKQAPEPTRSPAAANRSSAAAAGTGSARDLRPPDARPGRPPGLDGALPGEARKRAEEWVAATRAEFAKEPVDPAWAAETQAALVTASVHEDLADTVDQMQSFDAECRSRRCMIEVRFSSRGAALDWLGIYLLNADPIRRASHQVILNPDGTATIILIGGA